jgi:hypothetical protein
MAAIEASTTMRSMGVYEFQCTVEAPVEWVFEQGFTTSPWQATLH